MMVQFVVEYKLSRLEFVSSSTNIYFFLIRNLSCPVTRNVVYCAFLVLTEVVNVFLLSKFADFVPRFQVHTLRLHSSLYYG
jgi:hypothetical protein